MCVPKRFIQRAALQQLRLRSRSFYPAVVHHVDLVGIHDGRKPVRNDNERFAAHKPRHALLDDCLVLRVRVGSCFVKYHDGCVFEHRAGNGDPLPLTAGKMPTAGAGAGFKTVFQPQNEIIAAAVARRLLDLLIGRAGSSHADILAHGGIKQEIVLRHICNKPVVVFCADFADVRAADCNCAAGYIPEGRNQLCNRRFSASRRTDERVDRSFAEGKAYPVQHLGVVIPKVNIVQRNGAALRRFFRLRAR